MKLKYFLIFISILIIFILLHIYLLLNKITKKEKFTNFNNNKYPYDKTFIINLSETSEGKRRWSVIKNMNQFYNKERFPAIYGKTYNYSNEVNKKIITEDWDFGKWKYGKSKIIPFDKGEIGVGLSHYYIWKKLSEDHNLNTILILEDDAINIHPQFVNIVNEKIKLLPNDWDIFLLGFWLHRGDINQKPNKNEIYKVKDFVLLHSYIINKKGANKLLKYLPIDMPVDSWISKHSNKINIYRHNIIKEESHTKPSSSLIRQLRNEKQIKNTNNW